MFSNQKQSNPRTQAGEADKLWCVTVQFPLLVSKTWPFSAINCGKNFSNHKNDTIMQKRCDFLVKFPNRILHVPILHKPLSNFFGKKMSQRKYNTEHARIIFQISFFDSCCESLQKLRSRTSNKTPLPTPTSHIASRTSMSRKNVPSV